MKNLRRFLLVSGIVILEISGLGLPLSGARRLEAKDETPVVKERSTLELQKYMKIFGGQAAGLEVMRLKEKKTDWEAIQISLTEMTQTLAEMKAADIEKKYQQFTALLGNHLSEMQSYVQAKNRDKFYNSFDQLTKTCFSCHAVHRPNDYLIPTGDHPKVSQN